MKDQAEQVKKFMLAAGQDCPDMLTNPSQEVKKLRLALHKEEALVELEAAFIGHDLVEVFDSVCDSLVVVLGTAIACGISPEQIEKGFDVVMKSNMTKFIDGHKDSNGKWIKGPSFVAPNLRAVLQELL